MENRYACFIIIASGERKGIMIFLLETLISRENFESLNEMYLWWKFTKIFYLKQYEIVNRENEFHNSEGDRVLYIHAVK